MQRVLHHARPVYQLHRPVSGHCIPSGQQHAHSVVWPGGGTVTMLDLGQHGRQLNLRLPAMPLSAKQVVHIVIIIFEWLIIHMCTFHQAVYFGASKKTVMPYGWRGNYSFGICTGQPCILDLNGLSVSRLYGT